MASILVVPHVDPLAQSAAQAAWWTFWATVCGIAIATVAAGIALWDLLQNTAQFRDFTRRPDLRASHWSDFEWQPRFGNDYMNAVVAIDVMNSGQRLSNKFLFELLVPTSVIYKPPPESTPELRQISGESHVAYQAPWASPHPLFPTGMSVELVRFTFPVRPDAESFHVYWRIYDDYGNYPKSGYGHWFLAVKPHQ